MVNSINHLNNIDSHHNSNQRNNHNHSEASSSVNQIDATTNHHFFRRAWTYVTNSFNAMRCITDNAVDLSTHANQIQQPHALPERAEELRSMIYNYIEHAVEDSQFREIVYANLTNILSTAVNIVVNYAEIFEYQILSPEQAAQRFNISEASIRTIMLSDSNSTESAEMLLISVNINDTSNTESVVDAAVNNTNDFISRVILSAHTNHQSTINCIISKNAYSEDLRMAINQQIEHTQSAFLGLARRTMPTIKAKTVTLERGNEFTQLMDWSQKNIGKRFIVKYEGERATDVGGLTRDALTASYEQLTAHHLIVANCAENTFELSKLLSEVNVDSSVATDLFKKMGHLLGLTTKHNCKKIDLLTDTPLSYAIFENIIELQPLMKTILAKEASDTAINAVEEFSNYALMDDKDNSAAQKCLQTITTSPDSISDFTFFLKIIGITTEQLFSQSTMNESDNASDKNNGNYWIDHLWDSTDVSHISEIQTQSSISFIKDVSNNLSDVYDISINSASDFLTFFTDIATPKLAVAYGFEELNLTLPKNKQVNNASLFEAKVVQRESPKKIFQDHMANGGTKDTFFDHYFTVYVSENTENKNSILYNTKNAIIYLIENSTDQELKDIFKYIGGAPNLLEEKKITITVSAELNQSPDPKSISLPVAHSCARQLDIDVNGIIKNKNYGIDESSLKDALLHSIKVVKELGSGGLA